MNLSKDSPSTQCDLEAGSPNANTCSGGVDGEDYSSDPFDISRTKNAPVQRLNRWRQASLVLNATRRFRYTLDLKKEEERKQILKKIIVHTRAIQAACRFKEAEKNTNGESLLSLSLKKAYLLTQQWDQENAYASWTCEGK